MDFITLKEILFPTLHIERKNVCVLNLGDFFPSFSYLIQIRTSRNNILLKNSMNIIYKDTQGLSGYTKEAKIHVGLNYYI